MGSGLLVWGSTSLLVGNPASDVADVTMRASDGSSYWFEALADGTQFGNPEAVITQIRSHLQDGSLASVTSHDNRQGTVRVVAHGDSYRALAAAEKRLAAEAEVPGYSTLTWTPNVALAYPTVFDVVYATVAWEFDDLSELRQERYFRVEFELLPHGRDENLTVVQAAGGDPVEPVAVTVDDGTDAAPWSVVNGSVPTASGGAVRTTSAGQPRRSATQAVREISQQIQRDTLYALDWQGATVTNLQIIGRSDFGFQSPTISSYVDNTGLRAGFQRTWFSFSDAFVTSYLAFAFSALTGDSLAIDALTEGTARTVIDNGSSATGWKATHPDGNPALASSDGALRFTAGGRYDPQALTLTRAGDFDVEATRYVTVAGAVTGTAPRPTLRLTGPDASGDEVTVTAPLVTRTAAEDGMTRTTYSVPAALRSTVTALTLGWSSLPHGTQVAVDEVEATNTAPGVGTRRQQGRTLQVGGSARARASLSITAPAETTLGDLTILFTRTQAADSVETGRGTLTPALRGYRVGGSDPAADPASISGATNRLTDPSIYHLPANQLREAAYLLMARMRATVPGAYTLTWAAFLVDATGEPIAETRQLLTGQTVIDFPAYVEGEGGVVSVEWQTNELALLQLPTVPVADDSDLLLHLQLQATPEDGLPTTPQLPEVVLDEAWAFDLIHGALTVADSTGLTRLEVRTADLRAPERTVWVGTAPGGVAVGLTRGDWRTVPGAGTRAGTTAASLGNHVLEPGTVDVFFVTSGTEGASAVASYYRAWLHNAGEPDVTDDLVTDIVESNV